MKWLLIREFFFLLLTPFNLFSRNWNKRKESAKLTKIFICSGIRNQNIMVTTGSIIRTIRNTNEWYPRTKVWQKYRKRVNNELGVLLWMCGRAHNGCLHSSILIATQSIMRIHLLHFFFNSLDYLNHFEYNIWTIDLSKLMEWHLQFYQALQLR